VLARLKAFGLFWYDFIVGDDWRVAGAVVVAFLVTWGVSTTSVSAWWIVPVFVFILIPVTLWRTISEKG
jgi:uncharacterized membrane protein